MHIYWTKLLQTFLLVYMYCFTYNANVQVFVFFCHIVCKTLNTVLALKCCLYKLRYRVLSPYFCSIISLRFSNGLYVSKSRCLYFKSHVTYFSHVLHLCCIQCSISLNFIFNRQLPVNECHVHPSPCVKKYVVG